MVANQTTPTRWVSGDKAGTTVRLLYQGSMKGNFRYIARCPKGHLYDEANARISTEGYQHCRTCDRDRKRSIAAAAHGETHWRDYRLKETA